MGLARPRAEEESQRREEMSSSGPSPAGPPHTVRLLPSVFAEIAKVTYLRVLVLTTVILVGTSGHT